MTDISEVLNGLLGQAQSATGIDFSKYLGPVTELLNSGGGIQGLIDSLQNSSIAEAAQSWISTGANAAVSPSQIAEALPTAVQDLAAKTGSSVEQASATLSEMLPQLVDKLTPGGKIPTSLDDLTGILGNIPGFDQITGMLGGLLGGSGGATPSA